MLRIWIGDPEDNCPKPLQWSVKGSFIFSYEDSWFDAPWIKDMIKDVDKAEFVSPRMILDPVFGAIGIDNLSGGTQTVISMYNDDSLMYNLTSCGDNCAKWVLRAARDKDILVRAGHIMEFDFSEGDKLEIVNNHKIVDNYPDYIKAITGAIGEHERQVSSKS